MTIDDPDGNQNDPAPLDDLDREVFLIDETAIDMTDGEIDQRLRNTLAAGGYAPSPVRIGPPIDCPELPITVRVPPSRGLMASNRPRVPLRKRGTRYERDPRPRRDGPQTDRRLQDRKSKQTNTASVTPGRSLSARRQEPRPIANVGPVEGRVAVIHADHPRRSHRRPDGNPSLAEPILSPGRSAWLATLIDFHMRRTNTTGSFDEEIRLLRAHAWVYLALILRVLILGLGLLAAIIAFGTGVAPAQLVVSLAVGTVIGAAAHPLWAWITSRMSMGKNGRSRRR
ncbi:hypothetical protein I0C86_09260 [Plantactinospora sp. S1510]|uniref:DUF2335 domain-containing protein n=1 Tax=Plantactinospora alkalitolerans TaxID=2789879 RepID=A0ABS0GSK2_9ACTN|nr:hypothetical protein [Plantactinospora alkalitolerans]MBF9129163.1 hypothetical protein [Plantactinospora alkalitolerans]